MLVIAFTIVTQLIVVVIDAAFELITGVIACERLDL
jgi:hypothetical protein